MARVRGRQLAGHMGVFGGKLDSAHSESRVGGLCIGGICLKGSKTPVGGGGVKPPHTKEDGK